MTALTQLIKRLEAAHSEDQLLNADIASAVGWTPGPQFSRHTDNSWRINGYINTVIWPPRYTYSIDAAVSLVPNDQAWMLSRYENRACWAEVGDDWQYQGATPALAICVAALKARAALSPHSAGGAA